VSELRLVGLSVAASRRDPSQPAGRIQQPEITSRVSEIRPFRVRCPGRSRTPERDRPKTRTPPLGGVCGHHL